MNNLKLIRLITGEEIIAEISIENGQTVLRNPHVLVFKPGRSENEANINLVPWVQLTTDKEIRLDRAHILYMVTPINDFAVQYQAITSKILMPERPSFQV